MLFLTRIARRLAQPDVPFYALPWLMFLLVAGTVAQRDWGLYIAQKTFFSSWVFWTGPLPLPGGYTTIAVIGLALACKLLLASPWRLRDAGIVLAHGGALLLLLGGLLTALSAREGYIMIAEGQTAQIMSDYHAKQLTVTDADGNVILAVPHAKLRPDTQFTAAGLTLQILEYCHNCTPAPQTEERRGNLPYIGAAQQVKMIPAPREKDEEMNHSAVTISIRGAADGENGVYLMTDVMPIDPVVGDFQLRFSRVETTLPFALKLDDVRRELYAGTMIPRGYESDLQVIDGDITWPATIRMNEPLRYRGYTLYQSNYAILPDGGEATVLSAVKNTGWLFPYIASIIIAIGMGLHLILALKNASGGQKDTKKSKPKKNTPEKITPKDTTTKNIPHFAVMLGLLCGLAAFTPAPAQAAQTPFAVSDTGFRHIPVLHEGRIKPLDSFARAAHWRILGYEHPRGQSASQWLAELLFDPLAAAQRPQFHVRHPELARLLQLPARRGARYTFTEISAAIAPHADTVAQLAARENLTTAQEQLLALQQSIIDYTQLMRALSLLLPLSVTWPEADGIDYLSMIRHEEAAQNRLSAIITAKGEDIDAYTDEEKQIAAFALQMEVMRDAARGNSLLRVIPATWDDNGEWLSPWAAITTGRGGPDTMEMMNHWRVMIHSWMNGEHEAFLGGSWGQYYDTIEYVDETRLRAELLYNDIDPLNWAMYLYALAFILALAAWRGRLTMNPALAVTALAAVVHTFGMALRVYILARPPVGTLYESVLFVALVAAATALIAARKRPALLAAGTGMGAALLLAAPALIRDGDTLPVLVAVLNTNFWLATHVIIITAGYAFSILCALAAHGALAARTPMVAMTHRLGLLALLFTAVGTILGGIWADQSWGRFWGWDPKENGALLIVLWLVWAMHGRRAALLRPRLYAAALAAVNIIVALAWFGVNLLNVGLHSYGFTSGIASALSLFCAAQIALIIGLYIWGARRERTV